MKESQNNFQYGNVCAAQQEEIKLTFGQTGLLRIRCLDVESLEPVAADSTFAQPSGKEYRVDGFPEVDGYEHAVTVISGTMPEDGQSCTRIVYYSPIADSGYRPHGLRNAAIIAVATIFTIASCILPSPFELLYEHFFAEHTEPAPIVEVNNNLSTDEVIEKIMNSTDKKECDSDLSQITITFDFDDDTVMSPAIILGQVGNSYYYEVPQKDNYIASVSVISGLFDGNDHVYKVRYYSTTPKLPPEHPATSGQDSARDPSNQGNATEGGGPNDSTGYGFKDPAKDPFDDISGAHAPGGETNVGNTGNSSDDRDASQVPPGASNAEIPGANDQPNDVPPITADSHGRPIDRR